MTPTIGQRRTAVAAVGLVTTAFQACYSLIVSPNIPESGDAASYRLLGANLAAGRGYIRSFDFQNEADVIATAEFPPGFPALLAVLDLVGVETISAQRVALAAVGGATAMLTVLLATRWFRWRAALGLGLVAGLHPALFQPGAALLAESLFAFATVSLLVLAIRAAEQPSLDRIAVLGLAGGFAALVRSEGALIAAALGLIVVVATGSQARARATMAVVLVVTLAIAPGAWMVRNLRTFEEPVLLSNNLGSVLAGANCPDTYFGDLAGYWRVSPECSSGFDPRELREGDESTASRLLQRKGAAFARDHPGALPRVAATRVLRTFQLYEPEQQTRLATFEGRDRRFERIMSWIAWATYPLVAVGIAVLAGRRRWAQLTMLATPIVVVVVISAVTYGHARFRVPAEVPMILLAAIGARSLVERALSRTVAGGSNA